MSNYYAKSPLQMGQQIKVQELVVSLDDPSLFKNSGADCVVIMGEETSKIHAVLFKDDSAATLTPVQASAISKVDSTALTAGGDEKAIKITALNLAANDCLIVKYTAKE